MTDTLLLTRTDVAKLLPMVDAIAAVEEGFRAQAAGNALPSRILGLHAPEGGFHVKGAGLRKDRLYVAVKVNANFPGNPAAHGLPTIQGLLALHDGEDGRLLAVMDSIELTARRTGAATGLAARHLAREDAATLEIIGCGAQAAYQVAAVAAVRPIRTVRACDSDLRRARLLAEQIARTLELDASAYERANGDAADIVVTCTPSTEAFLGVDDVAAGTFVAAVGADSEAKQEITPALLAKSRVVVDALDQAVTIGDLHHAVKAGALNAGDVHGELWELVTGRKPGRASRDEITVFDSTGLGIQDVAAAAHAYECAVAAGLGTKITFAD